MVIWLLKGGFLLLVSFWGGGVYYIVIFMREKRWLVGNGIK